MNDVTHRIFSGVSRSTGWRRGRSWSPGMEQRFGQGKGFGWGTVVHHAAGTSAHAISAARYDGAFDVRMRWSTRTCGSAGHAAPVRLRHVRDAVQLGREPGPQPGGTGAPPVRAPRRRRGGAAASGHASASWSSRWKTSSSSRKPSSGRRQVDEERRHLRLPPAFTAVSAIACAARGRRHSR